MCVKWILKVFIRRYHNDDIVIICCFQTWKNNYVLKCFVGLCNHNSWFFALDLQVSEIFLTYLQPRLLYRWKSHISRKNRLCCLTVWSCDFWSQNWVFMIWTLKMDFSFKKRFLKLLELLFIVLSNLTHEVCVIVNNSIFVLDKVVYNRANTKWIRNCYFTFWIAINSFSYSKSILYTNVKRILVKVFYGQVSSVEKCCFCMKLFSEWYVLNF